MQTVTVESFDAAGVNVTRRETTSYEYDATGIHVSSTQETDADGDGPDAATVTTTTYLSDRQNPTGYAQVLSETVRDAAGQVAKRIVYTLGHMRLGQTTFDVAGGSVTHVVHADGHGSTRVLTDAGLVVVEVYNYDAHGNALGFDPAQALTNVLYSGEQFDSRIGQTYLRARWYDATTGRFNRLDPFFGNLNDPQSLHKYLYMHGDPVNMTDPTGLFGGLVGFTIGVFFGQNVRSTATNEYGNAHQNAVTSLQAIQAGASVQGALIFAFATTYGPDAVVGAAGRALALLSRGIGRDGGGRLIGVLFAGNSRKAVLPGPFLVGRGAELIPRLGDARVEVQNLTSTQRRTRLKQGIAEGNGVSKNEFVNQARSRWFSCGSGSGWRASSSASVSGSMVTSHRPFGPPMPRNDVPVSSDLATRVEAPVDR